MQNEQLDLGVLGDYLNDHINGFGHLISAEKFQDGQSNPTYLLETNLGQYVLRKQPNGTLLKSAHAVDREFQVIRALQNTPVPVPKVFHLCEETAVLGCLFYVMSFESGHVFWNPRLPDLNNSQRSMVYDEMNRVLAELHNVDVTQAGLENYGKPGDYFQRQLARWTRQYRASQIDKIEAMDTLITWLADNLPQDDGRTSLIHGDYRIDNFIFDATQLNIKAVLDWELSTLGHPYADLSYQCMQWRLDQHDVIPGLGGVDRAALGIPTEQEYVERYCERRGIIKIENWDFYLAFSHFRLAAILQGVLKRAVDGNASSAKAFHYGALAPKLANMALALIE